MSYSQTTAIFCPTQRSYAMTINHAAAADYQSLYSQKRRDLDVFNVCKHTFIFYPKSTISPTLMATAGFYYTVATKLYFVHENSHVLTDC